MKSLKTDRTLLQELFKVCQHEGIQRQGMTYVGLPPLLKEIESHLSTPSVNEEEAFEKWLAENYRKVSLIYYRNNDNTDTLFTKEQIKFIFLAGFKHESLSSKTEEWISVKNPPEYNKIVLGYCSFKHDFKAVHRVSLKDDNKWYNSESFITEKLDGIVIAWQPLPKSPKK